MGAFLPDDVQRLREGPERNCELPASAEKGCSHPKGLPDAVILIHGHWPSDVDPLHGIQVGENVVRPLIGTDRR